MADGKYMLLAPRCCGARAGFGVIPQTRGRGRPKGSVSSKPYKHRPKETPNICKWCKTEFVGFKTSKYCGTACRVAAANQIAKLKTITSICQVCGAQFVGSYADRRKTCSKACARQVQTKGASDRHLSVPFKTHKCRICGVEYETRAKVSTLCSNKCKMQSHYERTGVAAVRMVRKQHLASKKNERLAVRTAEIKRRKVERDANTYWREELKQLERMRIRFCADCGIIRQSRGSYCKPCAESRLRAIKHANRVAGKAMRKAARIDLIDPIKVFERDNWICYLCGCETPKWHRGSYEHSAPEVEHVVPITRGGLDSYDNVRCSCRKCNGIKGDRLLEEIGGAFF